MTAHGLTQNGWRRSRARRGAGNGVLQLGWFHFWLLIAILGGILGLVGLVFLAHLSSL
jgi:hypothetical protein